MFPDDVGELDESGVEGFDAAFGEIFKEATESDEMIGLGDDFEVFSVLVGFAVELEAEFAKEFLGDVDREEITEFGVVAFNDAEAGGFFEDGHGEVLKTEEVATVIIGGFFGTAFFDFEVVDEINDKLGQGRLVQDLGFGDDLFSVIHG